MSRLPEALTFLSPVILFKDLISSFSILGRVSQSTLVQKYQFHSGLDNHSMWVCASLELWNILMFSLFFVLSLVT